MYEMALKLSTVNNGEAPSKLYSCYELIGGSLFDRRRREYKFDVWAASLEEAETQAREVLKTRRFTVED